MCGKPGDKPRDRQCSCPNTVSLNRYHQYKRSLRRARSSLHRWCTETLWNDTSKAYASLWMISLLKRATLAHGLECFVRTLASQPDFGICVGLTFLLAIWYMKLPTPRERYHTTGEMLFTSWSTRISTLYVLSHLARTSRTRRRHSSSISPRGGIRC